MVAREVPGEREGVGGHFVSEEVVDGVEVWMVMLFVGGWVAVVFW